MVAPIVNQSLRVPSLYVRVYHGVSAGHTDTERSLTIREGISRSGVKGLR